MSDALKRASELAAALDRDQRFAGTAAVGLLVTMFLPWYEKNVIIPGAKTFASDSISAFGAVSFVEAAIFLVSAGVLALLAARADRRPFHLPGGDGTVILAAGLWATALIFFRVFDRPNVSGEGATVGIQWGFFVAFVAAGALAVAGQRIRVAGRPEPPLPAADPGPRAGPDETAATGVVARDPPASTEVTRRRPSGGSAVRRDDARQMTLDDAAGDPPLRPGEIPPARDRG